MTVLEAEAQATTGPLDVVLMVVPEPRNSSFVERTRELIGSANLAARELAADPSGRSAATDA